VADTYQLDRVDTVLSLKDKAYSAIKEAILSLRFEPGMPLVESDLAQQLGISKTPVRDALYVLEREGFVTRIPFKGTYVTEVTTTDIREIFQLRAILEGFAARLAAPLLTAGELEEMECRLQAAEAALAEGNQALCSSIGQGIHEALLDKAGNQRLTSITHNLDDHVQRLRVLSDRITGRLNKSVQEHRRVQDALYRRDPDAAEQAMRDHLLSVIQDLCAPGE
jgi:GntR family transcriptional regulator, rspAB operon transcriptional repressor